MALEASHIRFALDIKDKLGVKNIERYVSGVIYPDSRYRTKIDRLITHPKDFLEKDFFGNDDFKKGWYAHLLYDKILREYTLEQLQDVLSNVQDNWVELWVHLTALKILQDVEDAKAYEITRYLPHLSYVESPNGEELSKLVEYNNYFQAMYPVTEKDALVSYYDMWDFLGIENERLTKLKGQTETYRKDARIKAFIETVYIRTLEIGRVNYP